MSGYSSCKHKNLYLSWKQQPNVYAMNDALTAQIRESIAVKEAVIADTTLLSNLATIIEVVTEVYAQGHKILIAGNGGSAADAQHFAAELVGRFTRERKAYPAIALTTDSSILTAWANDYEYETVFARQLEGLAQPGDVFIGISTSGNSKNIIAAVKECQKLGIRSICLLGNNGGALKDLATYSFTVPSPKTARIQEVHILAIHLICEAVEQTFV
jgi:D-sedoheptulose 7-phosphate isomerase